LQMDKQKERYKRTDRLKITQPWEHKLKTLHYELRP
jgi:hypothetical protein